MYVGLSLVSLATVVRGTVVVVINPNCTVRMPLPSELEACTENVPDLSAVTVDIVKVVSRPSNLP